MAKYKSHLLDRLEGLSDLVKWIVVGIATVAAVLVAVLGVSGANTALHLAPGEADAAPPTPDAPALVQPETTEQPEPQPEPQAQQEQHRPATQRRQPPAQPTDTTRYLSEFEGYSINGIMLLEGAPPEALLKKDGDIRSVREGDTVSGYTVKSIHRHHIILERGASRIHLNRVQF
ncbi:MAG: hypothetical protein K8R90_06370 [Candidatus Cloacimonetes bacterium]|nr:hypothetical protein [Candidatus Cloacimonadota bacterium]